MQQQGQLGDSHVLTCLAEGCSYNCRDECCAPNIEVGDEHPRCDMFTTGEVPIGDGEPPVMDCKVMDCHFNQRMACSAGGVTMINHSGHADCGTYRH
jgi:hypothetical protein